MYFSYLGGNSTCFSVSLSITWYSNTIILATVTSNGRETTVNPNYKNFKLVDFNEDNTSSDLKAIITFQCSPGKSSANQRKALLVQMIINALLQHFHLCY